MFGLVKSYFQKWEFCFFFVSLLALDRARYVDAKMMAATVILSTLVHIHAGDVVAVQQVTFLTLAVIPAWQVDTLSPNTRVGSTLINILAVATCQAVARVAVAGVFSW